MSSKYDRAITVFSPDGHLFQVEYAQEAVKKGATAVAIRGANCLVLGVEKKATAKLQEDRTVRKIVMLDEHVAVAFAGLNADARVLTNRARIECQSYKLTAEDPVSVEYIARHIASLKQKYTQSNGRRPFGLSMLITGFDDDGTPRLYLTDPAGTHYEWKANAIGRQSKVVREWLETKYNDEAVADEDGSVQLAVGALMEVVQQPPKTEEQATPNMEVLVMRRKVDARGNGVVTTETLPTDRLRQFIKQAEANKAADDEKKKLARLGGAQS